MEPEKQSEVFAGIVEHVIDKKVDDMLQRLKGLLHETLDEILEVKESQRSLEARVARLEQKFALHEGSHDVR